MSTPDVLIDCIDCGGRCHLLSTGPADDPPRPGDILVYRCEDCADRWDVVFGEDAQDGPSDDYERRARPSP